MTVINWPVEVERITVLTIDSTWTTSKSHHPFSKPRVTEVYIVIPNQFIIILNTMLIIKSKTIQFKKNHINEVILEAFMVLQEKRVTPIMDPCCCPPPPHLISNTLIYFWNNFTASAIYMYLWQVTTPHNIYSLLVSPLHPWRIS